LGISSWTEYIEDGKRKSVHGPLGGTAKFVDPTNPEDARTIRFFPSFEIEQCVCNALSMKQTKKKEESRRRLKTSKGGNKKDKMTGALGGCVPIAQAYF